MRRQPRKNCRHLSTRIRFSWAASTCGELDAAYLFKLATSVAHSDMPADVEPAIAFDALQKALVQKGAREIYVVYGATDFPQKPCLLVPIGESPPQRKDLYELLKMIYAPEESAWANIGGFLCVGIKNNLEKLKTRQPSDRPEIAEAFAAVGDGACQVVLAPSAETRKSFEQIAPNLPKELGGGSIETFTRGMNWIGLSVGPTPKAAVRVVVKCANAEAAQKLDSVFVKAMQEAKKLLDEEKTDRRTRDALEKLYNRARELMTAKNRKRPSRSRF